MSVITHAVRKSNLATMIGSPGGISVGTAIARARANLETMRELALQVIEASIGALEAIPEPTGPEDTSTRREQAYREATSLIDAAGPFELFDLCRAASGLCDLIGVLDPEQPFDWRIVTVHARSLRLLQALPPEAAMERAHILESLNEVVQRKLAQTG
ncbi:MAG: chemotaxis protein CheE [bacterium]